MVVVRLGLGRTVVKGKGQSRPGSDGAATAAAAHLHYAAPAACAVALPPPGKLDILQVTVLSVRELAASEGRADAVVVVSVVGTVPGGAPGRQWQHRGYSDYKTLNIKEAVKA